MVEGGTTIVAKSSSGRAATDKTAESDEFESTSNAFEGLGGGQAQMQSMHLLIKTQLLICRRYSSEMSKYKYPAYRMLLDCLAIPGSCCDLGMDSDPDTFATTCLMTPERAQFVRTAADLVFHTCLVSPLNAEELVAEGGLPILESLLNFYVTGIRFLCDQYTTDGKTKTTANPIASEGLVLDIISNLVHTISGIAFYESGRRAILSLEKPSRLSLNFRRCLECHFGGIHCRAEGTSAMKRFVVEGIASMAKTKELQDLIIGCGTIWPLITCMLGFDPTLEGSSGLVTKRI